jgi:hypothetical protein
MHPSILCRERLLRILDLLDRYGGHMPARTLQRNHGVFDWEVEQAAELGWLAISERKPAVGRPARVVEKLSKTQSAKLPPHRNEIERHIPVRHRLFAIHSVSVTESSSPLNWRLRSATESYLLAFPRCKSRGAAAVGASRLMKLVSVKLMRRWLFCNEEGRVSGDMPWSLVELKQELEAIGAVVYRHADHMDRYSGPGAPTATALRPSRDFSTSEPEPSPDFRRLP